MEEECRVLVDLSFKGDVDGLRKLMKRVREREGSEPAGGGEAALREVLRGGAEGARGRRPLHAAVRAFRIEALRVLLEAGADVHTLEVSTCAERSLGISALQQAVLSSCPQAVILLLRHGADPTAPFPYGPDGQAAGTGRTPLEEARTRGHGAVVVALERFEELRLAALAAPVAPAAAAAAPPPTAAEHAAALAAAAAALAGEGKSLFTRAAEADKPPWCGEFEIGIAEPKTPQNVGTLMRSTYQLGGDAVFTAGRRYRKSGADTLNAAQFLQLNHFGDLGELISRRRAEDAERRRRQPPGAAGSLAPLRVVGIEKGGTLLSSYTHPEHALYVLGAEDHGMREHELALCDDVVTIEAVRQPMFNVAVAGTIVMYHRVLQRQAAAAAAGIGAATGIGGGAATAAGAATVARGGAPVARAAVGCIAVAAGVAAAVALFRGTKSASPP